jgi:MarR family transcriptional regulator, organic hydroperoxide resistance regulator
MSPASLSALRYSDAAPPDCALAKPKGASTPFGKLLRTRNICTKSFLPLRLLRVTERALPTTEKHAAEKLSSVATSGDVADIVETLLYLYTESRRVTKTLARAKDLTGPQLSVLKGLEQIGVLSLSALSEQIHARNSTVTGIIDRMEQNGLVRRERSSEDRRVIQIRLTRKGLAIARETPLEPMTLLVSALASLGEDDTKALLRILRKVAKEVRIGVERAEQEQA